MHILELTATEQPTYWNGWEAAKTKQLKESNPHKDSSKQKLWNEGFDAALLDHQIQQIRYQGFDARKKGVVRDDNPFVVSLTETTKRDAWYEGWDKSKN